MRKKKTHAHFDMNELLNDPQKRAQLQGFVEEMALALQQVKDKQHAVKDMRVEAKDTLGIPPRLLMKLVREHNEKGFLNVEIKELEEVAELAKVISP